MYLPHNIVTILFVFFISLSNASPVVISCTTCIELTTVLQELLASGASLYTTQLTLTQACIQAQLLTPDVCNDFFQTFSEAERDSTAGANAVGASATQLCGFQGYCPYSYLPAPLVTFPKPKPTHKAPAYSIEFDIFSPLFTKKVIQLSDIHLDPMYVEGSSTVCPTGLTCCHSEFGQGTGDTAAGYFGTYQCDIPFRTLDNVLEQVIAQQPDIVIITGDNVVGDDLRERRDTVVSLNAYVAEALKASLPSTTKIYPTIGNHDTSPVNFVALPPLDFVYRPISQVWSSFLGPAATSAFASTGYYSLQVEPGLILISLETNYWNKQNLFIYNLVDPDAQLAWLVTELQAAEDSHQKVWIIGHIPPGQSDAVSTQGDQYYQIVNRYEDTIAGQFFGHRHYDSFEVFYVQDNASLRASSMAYVSPSVTVSSVNPSFRVYTYDIGSHYLVDAFTFVMNLTDANLHAPAPPVWKLEYSARQAYGMTDLFPQSWAKVVNQIADNPATFTKFYNYFWHEAPIPTCDFSCQLGEICNLRAGSQTIFNECISGNGTVADYNKIYPGQ